MPKPAELLGITGPGAIWKLQYGLPGVSGIKEASASALATFELVPYFAATVDGWVQVRVPVNAGTTSGSTYPRCELRQMKPGGTAEASWDSKKTDCWFEYELKVTHLPPKKPQMCIIQLHSDKNDLLEVIYQRNSAGGYEITQRVNGSSKGQLVIPHELNRPLILALAVVKGVPTVYRDGKAILTTSKMPQSKKTYAKLLNYLQSNSKTDKAPEYGELLARNVRTGTGAYPGPRTVPAPPPVDPPPVPIPDPPPVPVPVPSGQTLGVGGIAAPAGAILATGDTTAPLNISKPGVYDGRGFKCGRITVRASGAVVQNYRIVANGQYGAVLDADDIVFQNNDITGVKPSGDGDLNALTVFGNKIRILFNTAINYVVGDPGGSHTDAIQFWVSASHPTASSDIEIRGNRFVGPANPSRDNGVPSIHQCIMAEDYGRGGNSGGSSSGMKNWLIADNEFGDSWNQSIKLDGVDNVTITRNRFIGSSDKVMDVPQGSSVKFYEDNKITGRYKNGIGIPVTPGAGPGSPVPTPVPVPVPVPTPSADVVYVIRHAEKPSDPNSHILSPAGFARAQALAELLAPRTGTIRDGLLTPPTEIIVSEGTTASLRPYQTGKPLADRLHEVEVTTWAAADYKAAGTAIAAMHGVTLVIWAHAELPGLCKAFGVKTPSSWPDDRFDVIWIFKRTATGWAFSQMPQMVMPGDKSSVL